MLTTPEYDELPNSAEDYPSLLVRQPHTNSVTLNRPQTSHIQDRGCPTIGGFPCPQRNARKPEWETRYGADVMRPAATVTSTTTRPEPF